MKISNSDKYLIIDNLKRFIIKDLLCKQTSLENISLKEITRLTNLIVGIISNLEHHHNNNKIKNIIGDNFNWEDNYQLQQILEQYIYEKK